MKSRHQPRDESSFSSNWQMLTQVAASIQGESWYQMIHPTHGRKL